MSNIIQINNLNKSFGSVNAVQNLSFRVKKGELFAFLGINGAGKSTTINIMCGQLSKDSGSVFIDKHDLDKDMDYIKRELGVVFQSSVLDSALSVYDNLESRAALYGITGMTAQLLGFDGPTLNSMDSVSDRDYLIELLSAMSTIMMHLSRFSEEVIIWNSNEYQFVEIDDAYSTGSSIMPQKKNPDIAELVRGKTGRVYGALMSLLTTMKGIPLAYNKDMQEDKELVFDAIDSGRFSDARK